MALKPRYKRRIFWTIMSVAGAAAIAVVVVPPMVTLNSLKPRIEQVIAEQTGITAKIRGDVHFSLLGRATIVAHDIVVPMGDIGAAMFAMPLSDLLDLNNAVFSGNITIYNASVTVDSLAPQDFNHNITIYNSNVHFKGKDYEILRGVMHGGQLTGQIRTNDHKYSIEYQDDEFHITNNEMNVVGHLFANGTARGRMALETRDINGWFEFPQPKITERVNMTMNFEWDGDTGFNFTDIQSSNFSGNIEILPSGDKNIQLTARDIDIDFSFLMSPNRILNRTKMNLDFSGDIKFENYNFHHIKVNAIGTPSKFQIASIVADDITMSGGTIDADGAHDVMVSMPLLGQTAVCMYSGTPQNWKCSDFSYGDMTGSLSVADGAFEIFVQSARPMPPREELEKLTSKLGRHGKINFQFSDIGGTLEISDKNISPSYTFAHDKTIKWLTSDLAFLPAAMQDDIGDFRRNKNQMDFIPHSGRWTLSMTGNQFLITGTDARDWIANIDTRIFNENMPYQISGTYDKDAISDLIIQVAGMEFTGRAVRNNITLHTQILNLDSFVSQNYTDNRAELEFMIQSPIMLPFDVPVNLSLTADKLIYNGDVFANFVYALKPGTQTFSITDRDRGSLLATIEKQNGKYNIAATINKFVIVGSLLSSQMPLNIRDTVITAEINMTTHGNIEHDIWYNLTGDMDMSFDGGYLMGVGFDEFYASAPDIKTLNAEYALARALESGETQIKNMRLVGRYADGDFETTSPLELSMRHVDGTGRIEIKDGQMKSDLKLTLRGTSPLPAPISLQIAPNGARSYSLTEIMNNFDASYMRDFVKTHNRF